MYADKKVGGQTKSWILVEQEWSQSGIKQFKVEVDLDHAINGNYTDYQLMTPVKWDSFFYLEGAMASDTCSLESRTEQNVTIVKHQVSNTLSLRDKDRNVNLSEIRACFVYETAVYDDGIMHYEMPTLNFIDQTYEIQHNGFEWKEKEGRLQLPLTLRIMGYLGERQYESIGDDYDGDGLDDDTGEEIEIRCINEYLYEHQAVFIYEP